MPVADPELELRRGPGFDLLALVSFLLFLPSPRSATACSTQSYED